jgi:predicted nucleotidyltransferase
MKELPVDPQRLIERFDTEDVLAIVLMGSFAVGTAGTFSDIDLFRLVKKGADTEVKCYMVADTLLVVSNGIPSEVETTFTDPLKATIFIQGLRSGKILLDKEGLFKEFQEKAHAFKWDQELQDRADRYASSEMVGWIEEAHKGPDGLQRGGFGRLLNAQFGLSWGMAMVIQVQKGILIHSDNSFLEEIFAVVGEDSTWAALCRSAYGIDDPPPTLEETIIAGLKLYVETARLIGAGIQEADRPLIERTCQRIREAISY